MSKTIALVGTMDSKGREYAYVKAQIEAAGGKTLVIDVGTLGPPLLSLDVSCDEVLRAAKREANAMFHERVDGDPTVMQLVDGATLIIAQLVEQREIDGILALGGTRGTSLAAAIMRRLPVGFPKLIVSTVVSGDVSAWLGTKDIALIPAVADILGLNRITRRILSEAVGAIWGMAHVPVENLNAVPLIAITNIGLTTAGAVKAKEVLEAAGFETIVFHACGPGGEAMEALILEGQIEGVLDLATLEVMQELFNGLLLKKSGRMTAAGKMGIPQVVCPGGVDNIFGPREKITQRFSGRKMVHHSAIFSNTRATGEELRALAREQARRVNPAQGPVEWFVPIKGFCTYSSPGGEFFDPDADQDYVKELGCSLRPDIPVRVIDCTINDAEFAKKAAARLIQLVREHQQVNGQRRHCHRQRTVSPV